MFKKLNEANYQHVCLFAQGPAGVDTLGLILYVHTKR